MASIAVFARLSATRLGSKTFTKTAPVAGRRFLSTIKFTSSHEYVKVDGDIGIVGITDHAADALGDVVFVDLPSPGTSFDAGESFGSVESVKAASDVYSPVAGEVVEVNEELEGQPGTVNESPFESGWFMKLKIADKTQLDGLMDEAAYKAHCEDE
mmetsp:Transcript_1299/g.2101  ORF Transcript_1299/g.2101 Transcript_1299/m.2101 type:complete len:156 (+) Transcript_1299:76-543(+)